MHNIFYSIYYIKTTTVEKGHYLLLQGEALWWCETMKM